MDTNQSENQITLASYEAHAAAYVAGTPHGMSADVVDWISRATESLPATAAILEIGSAFGSDADHIESLGFAIQRTDGARSFVELLAGQGHDAYQLNVLTDDLGGPWDLIFANVVFLHFSSEQFMEVLRNCNRALRQDGRLAFSVKRGEDSEWSEAKIGAPRFFKYWSQEDLSEAVKAVGLELLDIRDGTITGDANKVYVVARKPD